ncbi:retrovirus-related pol polyprotein from transposon TNT 1-94 [Tanacetum coccineum]|uniref:Retrovirus-related pol polyprotein from transposon TNT 1-94 n=1 Tax=Tanacetum coccineum TaxID=301880 RepID=A0ABQ5AFB4_9ASTR
MLAPKCPTFNGRPTFANPMYLKKAQYEKPCLYEIPHDQSDPANRLVPDREETLTLERESREKLNKDLVKPYDYTKELVDQAWVKHSRDHFRAPTAKDMEVLIKTCLMPLALKTQNDSFAFVHELKQEMHADLKYVESLKKEIDELESDKAEFSNMYDMLLQECVSNDVMCSYLHSLSDLDAHTELQCYYLMKGPRNVNIQDLKAQLQDKNIAISELKKLIEKCKGKSVETKFDKPSVVRQPNAQRIPKPSVLGKPAPFSDFLERKSIYQIDTRTTQTRAPQLPQTSRNTNPRVSTSTGVIHKTNVSRPQLRSTQMKDKVMPRNSHVKDKKTEVEDHHRISSTSNKTKSVIAANDSLKSRTLNVNAVCATCGKCMFNSNHDACFSKYLNDVNARTKKPKIVQLIIFIVDSGCTKHMTGNLMLLCNFVETYLGTVRFGNDQFAPILSYGDLVQGNITINRVYYVEGLNHNLFSVGQFCDADLEVAFQKSTCFIIDLQGNDLLTAWLWHRRLSHLNFDYINLLSKKDVVIGLPKLKYVKDQLCSSCEVSKAKRSSFKTKVVPSSKGRLNLLHMDLCGPMRVASINGKKYILEGIEHQTSTPRTPEQNGVVERRNRTLVEAARTMLSASKLPLFFWAEAIATACYTQNRSIIIPTHEKTAYHIINDRKPSIKHLHIFGCTCYLTRDGKNLDKMKELASDYDNSGPDPQLQNVSPSTDTTVPSQQELDLLFGPLYDEFFYAGTSRINKSSSPTDNSAQQDTLPSTNIYPTTEPSTPTHINAEENNNDQAEFTNPFCTPVQEVA